MQWEVLVKWEGPKWEGLVMTWHEVFVGSPSGSPSEKGAAGDTLRTVKGFLYFL